VLLPVRRARSGLPAAGRAVVDLAGLAAGLPLAAIALLRGGTAVHPAGVVYSGRLVLPGARDAPGFLGERAEHDAIVRFSRSLGVPHPLPDLLGMTIRLPEVHGPHGHQDFMLVSSVDLPVAHHVFLPAGDVQQRPYSSSLPYRDEPGRRFLVGALPHPGSPRPEGRDEFDRLAAAAATGRLRFHLAVAPVGGRFAPVGEIWIRERLPQELDATAFNPWHTGGGIWPAGFLNRLRAYAYPASQAAWRARSATAAK
jgi:hypothetical protein